MSSQTGTDNSSKKVKGLITGMKAELKKVIWPTRKELVNYTMVVLVMCTIISLVVWLIDTGLHRLLSLIIR